MKPKSFVRTRNTKSKEFITTNGLRQGSVLLLFIMLIIELTKKYKNKVKSLTGSLMVRYRNLMPVQISDCEFAGDLVILKDNEKDLQYL